MTNDRRLRMPPAVAHMGAKLRFRAERFRRNLCRQAHMLWLHGVRRLERCLTRSRRHQERQKR